MNHIYPDYYTRFQCITSACQHNCCIGWEIDIDEDTLDRYQKETGVLGERLQRHISPTRPAHFVLDGQERCPFLNTDNLCDIITLKGHSSLCTVCREHPRFHNQLPDRTESGLGLCCEAAGALILGQRSPVTLPSLPTEDAVLILRDEVLALLQDRTLSIQERLERMLSHCHAALPDYSLTDWAAIFLRLERLEDKWGKLLTRLTEIDTTAFDAHMRHRQTEYEQFAIYLIYRHFANAPTPTLAAPRAAFATLGCQMLHALGAMQYAQTGDFTFADQVELARLFSSEIEYSEENLYTLFDLLTPSTM